MAGENGWYKQRILNIFSEIDNNLAAGIISQIYGLAAESPDPISLLINSGGGQVRHATAIIEAMGACPIPVHTIGIGQVYSAALLILLAGKKRSAFRHTLFMTHQFTSGAGNQPYKDLVGQREAEEWTFQWMKEYFKAHTKVKKWKEVENLFLGNEHYFDEQEALKLGIIDEVIETFPLVKIGA